MNAKTTLDVGERRPCATCGTMIVGAKSATGDSVLPVQLEPDDEKGNVLLQQRDGVLTAAVFGRHETLDDLRAKGVVMRRCHFADCPDADQFRRTDNPTPEGTTT